VVFAAGFGANLAFSFAANSCLTLRLIASNAVAASRSTCAAVLRARGAELPLAALAFVVTVALQAIREGRCGEGTAPLRRVAEDCKAGRRQGGYFRPTKTAFRKSGSIVYGQFDRIEL